MAHKPPYPWVDGGCIALSAFWNVLQQAGFSVAYHFLATQKHPFHPQQFPSGLTYTSYPISTEPSVSGYLESLIHPAPYKALRFFHTDIAKQLLNAIRLEKPDAVVLESLYSAVYLDAIRTVFRGPVYLRSHNIEGDIPVFGTDRMGALQRFIQAADLKKLTRWEKNIWQQVDGVISISEKDAHAILEYQPNTQTVGLTREISAALTPVSENRPFRLYHIGAMDWAPNAEALEEFKNTCWPVLHAAFPDMEMHIAGKGMPDYWTKNLPVGWFNSGEVENAQVWISDKDALVVPVKEGSGIRIKILEALAAGKAVLSTPLGREGIPAKPGEGLMEYRSPESLLEGLRILRQQDATHRSEQAQQFIRNFCSPETHIRTLQQFIQISA